MAPDLDLVGGEGRWSNVGADPVSCRIKMKKLNKQKKIEKGKKLFWKQKE